MRDSFDRHVMLKTLTRAGVSPRHFPREVMPCHYQTLYTFLSGKSGVKRFTWMTFERIHQFLECAIASQIFPLNKDFNSDSTREVISRAFRYWSVNNNLDSFTIKN